MRPAVQRAWGIVVALCLLGVGPALAQVDLEPAWMQIDATNTPPDTVPTLTVTVRNLGSSASSATTVGLFADLNNNGVYDAGTDEDRGSVPLGGLAANDGAMGGADQATVMFSLGADYDFEHGIGYKKVLYATVDPDNTVAESNEGNNRNFAYQVQHGENLAVPRRHRVLYVDFSAYYPPNMDNTRLHLSVEGGVEVTDFAPNADGSIQAEIEAAEAAGNPYDQIWWAANVTNVNLDSDFAYIRSWLTSRPHFDLVTDGGFLNSGGYSTYNGHPVVSSDQAAYVFNIYHNFRIRGGGLVTGTDHHPGSDQSNGPMSPTGYTAVNRFHDILGIGRYWGNQPGTGYRCSTDTSPLRTVPYLLLDTHNMGSTPGSTPTGFQGPGGSPLNAAVTDPLNVTLFTLSTYGGATAACDGTGDTQPAIASTISGTLGFGASLDTPCRVTVQGESATMTATASDGASTPLTYVWTSSLDGPLQNTNNTTSYTDSFDGAVLTPGLHTISVSITDDDNFVAGATMAIEVDGEDCNSNCVPDDEEFVDANGDGVLDGCTFCGSSGAEGLLCDDEDLCTPVDTCTGGTCLPNATYAFGDVNVTGSVSVSDASCTILVSLAEATGPDPVYPGCLVAPREVADLDCDGNINVTDTLLVVNLALTNSFPLSVDSQGNGCVDACEL